MANVQRLCSEIGNLVAWKEACGNIINREA